MNILAVAGGALALIVGAMFTYILTTETFASARVGGIDNCEVGTLGVFTSSYTPGCAGTALRGEPFEGRETLNFWPLFALQNGFGGTFESLQIMNTDPVSDDWPGERDSFDCKTSVDTTIAKLDAYLPAAFGLVDATLTGAIDANVKCAGAFADPAVPCSPTDADLPINTFGLAQLSQVGLIGTLGVLIGTPANGITNLEEAAAGYLAAACATKVVATPNDDDDLNALRKCVGAALLDSLFNTVSPGVNQCDPTSPTPNGNEQCVAYLALAMTGFTPSLTGAIDVVPAGIAGLLGLYADDSSGQPWSNAFTGSFATYFGAMIYNGVVEAAAAPFNDLTAQGSVAAGGLLSLIIGGCDGFGLSTIEGCRDGAGALSAIPADMTQPWFLGCLLSGSDPVNNPLTCGVANAFTVLKYFDSSEVEPLVSEEQKPLVSSIDTFRELVNPIGDAYNALTLGASNAAVCAGFFTKEDGHSSKTSADDVITDATYAGTLAAATANPAAVCGPAAALIDEKLEVIEALKEGFSDQVLGGVYSIDINYYTIEGGADLNGDKTITPDELWEGSTDAEKSASRFLYNRKLLSEAVTEKCLDDNEDAAAISKAQSLTPVGTGFVFVGALVGIAAALGGPKLLPLVPAVLVLIGSVLFMIGLLGVKNAPVYSLIGLPCNDGDVCYSAETGNNLALPAIAIGLISGLVLVVSAFVGGSSEDYSSFKETQVGAKA